MTKSHYVWAAALGAVVIGLFAFLFLQPTPNEGEADTPRVAVNLPLSGPIAVFMEDIPKALTDGLYDESQGAIAMKPDVQDNTGTPSGAVTALRAQQARGFDIYISGSSEMSSALLGELDRSGVPHFVVAFDAFMVERGKSRLRLLPNYKTEAPLWIRAAQAPGAKRIAAITLNNAPIEEQFASLILPPLRASGAEVQQFKFEWEGTNYALLVSQAAAFKPDVILVSGYSVHLLPIKLELNRQGLAKVRTVMALDYVDLLHNGSDKAQLRDTYFMCPDFEVRTPGSPGDKWASEWRRRYGKEPAYPAAYAYDTGRLIARAAAKSPRPSHADLLAAQPFDGVTGRVRLDAKGDLVSTLGVCILNSDGKAARALQ